MRRCRTPSQAEDAAWRIPADLCRKRASTSRYDAVVAYEGNMSLTPQQYTERILGQLEGRQPLSVLAATAATLDRLIGSVPAAALRSRPAPQKWAVNEILAHLADAEIVIAFRIRSILGSPGISVAAYDQDRWVTSGHYDERDSHKSVEQFRVLRDGNLALLESLEPEQWKHHGMHSERGPESIEHIVRMTAGHDINHLRQIEQILVPASSAAHCDRQD